MMLFFLVHPPTLIMVILGLLLLAGKHRNRWTLRESIILLVVPTAINPALWYFGASVFGLRLWELGGLMYLVFVLPLNGLVFGWASVLPLSFLGQRTVPGRRFIIHAIGIQLMVLAVWFAFATHIHVYGNVFVPEPRF